MEINMNLIACNYIRFPTISICWVYVCYKKQPINFIVQKIGEAKFCLLLITKLYHKAEAVVKKAHIKKHTIKIKIFIAERRQKIVKHKHYAQQHKRH